MVSGTQEVKQWILSWGSGAQVLEPASLREEIRQEAQALLASYDGMRATQGEPVSTAG